MADEVNDEKQTDQAFTEGFNLLATPATADAPKADEPEKKTDEVVAAAEADKEAPPVKEELKEAPQPEYVQITKEKLAELEAGSKKAADLDAKLDKAFGTLGGLQDVVNKLRSETPKGAAVEIPEDVVAEMAEDYPELAAHFRKALEKTLKGVRGTGSAEPAAIDPETVSKLVADDLKKREIATLDEENPDWRTVVGAVDSADKADPNNAFRKWLATQPAEYQTKVTSTQSASVLNAAINKFREATKAPPSTPKKDDKAPQKAARKDRIAAAIPAKGEGSPPAPSTKTDDDAFAEGFKSG